MHETAEHTVPHSIRPRGYGLLMVFNMIIGGCFGAFISLFMYIIELIFELIFGRLLAQPLGFNSYWYIPLVVCTFGGALVGLLQRKYGSIPAHIEQIMTTIKVDGRLDYSQLPAMLSAAFISLAAGGSVGPEAGLMGAIGGAAFWLTDVNKTCYKVMESGPLTFKKFFGIVTHDPSAAALPAGKGLKTSPDLPPYLQRYFAQRMPLLALTWIGGTLAFLGMNRLGIGTKMHQFSMQGSFGTSEFLATFICLLVAFIFARLDKPITWFAERICYPLADKPIARGMWGGLLLGILAMFVPFVLSSGESTMTLLDERWMTYGVAVLGITAVLKLVSVRIMFAASWKGGQFFPLFFSSFSLGFFVAAFLRATGMPVDPVWCVALTGCAASSLIMRQPLICLGIMLLMFNSAAWPALLIGAALAFALQKKFDVL